MIYTIQNEFLTVRVEDLGAQLSSIQAPDGTEYLWQGDPDIWARRAPILFPFIARLRPDAAPAPWCPPGPGRSWAPQCPRCPEWRCPPPPPGGG